MLRTRALRAFAALSVACALPLLFQAPSCASHACPMGNMARTGCVATGTMGMDCCQGTSGRLAPAPAAAPEPDLLASAWAALDPLTGLDARPLRALTAPPLPAPAVVQGVGLHTLFAVFLI